MRLLRALALGSSLALGAAFGAAAPALAQIPQGEGATLVADHVALKGRNTLTATGSVEVLHKGAVLRARAVEYDRGTGKLKIDGPIVLTDAKGTLVLASQAELSDDMRDGILSSARLVLEQQLQLAAVEMQRIDGRHTVLNRVVASSCHVCAANPTPLWEIRARRVVHDGDERQIYFDNTQFRFAGVPVMWLPYLRMPDPSLTRTAGFLTPRFFTSSRRGTGMEMPYFFPLGPSRDLTLTPGLTTKDGQSLGFRYRQAFNSGEIALVGAVSHDQILAGRRGWLATEGRFDMPAGFELRFAGETLSDPAYFRDYGLTDKDRLDSFMLLSRTRDTEYIGARLSHARSLRDQDVNAYLPQASFDLTWQRRIKLPHVGGTLSLTYEDHFHRRSSNIDGDFGRDVQRSSLEAFWRRDWLLPAGMLLAVEGGVAFDRHKVLQDSRWSKGVSTTTPAALIELRWPWVRLDGMGNSDVLEPVVQYVNSRPTEVGLRAGALGPVPNEDSILVEFDEGNLFGFSRFAGADRREGGERINMGLSWTRRTISGWHIAASAGRVHRLSERAQFSEASGLSGRNSDWVTSLHMATPGGVLVQGRIVMDDGLDLSRGEMRLAFEQDRYGIATGWLWAQSDPLEGRLEDTSEWVFDGRMKINDGWTARSTARHDFVNKRTTSAGLALEYVNECLRVEASVARRFTSSSTLKPTTDFGLSVDLLGFGTAGAGAGKAGRCRG